jgi:hypothetical protein
VPTADIACPDLALGPVPLTPAAASRLVHSIEPVENLNNSATNFDSSYGAAHYPHARSGLTASQHLCSDLMRRGVPCPTNSPRLSHSPSVKNALREYTDQFILTHALEISYHAVTVLPQYTVTQYEDTPVAPPKRYRSVPTADIACLDLALGPVPLTPAAASRLVHSIETVENLNNSAENFDSADKTVHYPHARSGLTASQHLCGDP